VTPGDREERKRRTLATRNHDVIKRWAQEGKAVPATVPGTEHGGRPGVLRLDFPGYGGRDLKKISWADWLGVFDSRKLTFLFQEHKRDGSESNFFRLNSPDHEDA
jgi:hypothetical protein